jgi:hypothetical protein
MPRHRERIAQRGGMHQCIDMATNECEKPHAT